MEQAHVVQLLRSISAHVYVLGHPSPNDGRKFRGTSQTPGLPDLLAFLPMGGSIARRLLVIECKAKGGRLRNEQRFFRELCGLASVDHVVGGLDAVIAWLCGRGYVKAEQFPTYRQPEAR